MAEEEGKVPPCNDSASAHYLQSGPDTPHTCWFLVGHADGQAPELVAGCRLHMMTYSVPLRNMLYDSEIAEKGTKKDPVEIPDIKPDTFRNFVKFINFNNIPRLSLKEAVDLVYVAEKYIVEDLKSKLEEHIPPLLNVENVFVPLKQPECFQNDALKNAIDKIVQKQTKEVFAKDGFLELTSTELQYIVSQDTLAVNELELWKAVLRWAKHKAESEGEKDLRECMLELLKHIRFCTLGMKDFCTEVVTTGILTPDEITSINMVFGGKLDCEKSNVICYKLSPRSFSLSDRFTFNLYNQGINKNYGNLSSSHLFITTDAKAIQILNGGFLSPKHDYSCPPTNLKLEFNLKLSLTRITDYSTDTSTEEPVQFVCVIEVAYDTPFIVPFGEIMKLQPYSKYKIMLSFSRSFHAFSADQKDKVLQYEGLVVSWRCGTTSCQSITHLAAFQFTTL